MQQFQLQNRKFISFDCTKKVKKYIENMSKIHSDFSARFKELHHELNTFKTDSTSITNKIVR